MADPKQELRDSIKNLNLMMAHSNTLDSDASAQYRKAAMDLRRSSVQLNKALNTDKNVHGALSVFERSYQDMVTHSPGISDASLEARLAQTEHRAMTKRINEYKKHLDK